MLTRPGSTRSAQIPTSRLPTVREPVAARPGLILGTFWREEMNYVGLATVSPDGEFNPVVLWHPEELKDIFPNSPT
jgi:hypothetical protein